MTTTWTIIDDTYSANGIDGIKRLRYNVSCTNPYSTGGEAFTHTLNKVFMGGKVLAVNPSVTIQNAGIAASGVIRATTASTTSLLLQFLNTGLPVTTAVGTWVDNTVANISNTSLIVELMGY